jgi:hypothetical protein
MTIQLLVLLALGLLQGTPSAGPSITCGPIEGVAQVLGTPIDRLGTSAQAR